MKKSMPELVLRILVNLPSGDAYMTQYCSTLPLHTIETSSPSAADARLTTKNKKRALIVFMVSGWMRSFVNFT